MKTGDIVCLRDGVTAYADGISIPKKIRGMNFYVFYAGIGKVLVSSKEDGPVYGWLKNGDVREADDAQ